MLSLVSRGSLLRHLFLMYSSLISNPQALSLNKSVTAVLAWGGCAASFMSCMHPPHCLGELATLCLLYIINKPQIYPCVSIFLFSALHFVAKEISLRI